VKIAVSADGRSPHTERWANAFAARGHDVTLVWRPNLVTEAALSRYGAKVRHFAATSMTSRDHGDELVEGLNPTRLRKRIEPDIVQGMYLVDFGWTAAKLGRPLVQFALGSDVLDLQPAPIAPSRGALGRAYVRWRTAQAVKRADAVLCDSEQIRRSLETYVPGTRVEIVRIGVELNGDASSGRQWRAELGIPNDAFVLLSTRLLTPNYNILTIIRAFARVRDAIPESVLILKDLESLGDDGYRAACRQLIDELGIGEAVRHVGEIERPGLLALYRAADVVVTVPTNDATAVSLLEAMAASVPVLASRTDGMDAAVLRDGETALLVTPEDPVGLADAIIRLHGSSALRGKLVAQAQMTVRSIGDFEQGIDRAEELYSELVTRG
jgi:glycosyltransferase involved in cell wall biosynthesis